MILQLDNVSLKRNGKWILRDIHWKVEEKENWVLYGINGAGKTALLNMLCSYYFPTSGEMQVLSMNLAKQSLGKSSDVKLVSSQQLFSKNCIRQIQPLKLL